MKVSPVAGPVPAVANPNEGQSAGAERMARAKAAAAGQAPVAPEAASSGDPQVDRIQNSLKRIKMKTQVSPDRHNRIEEPAELAVEAPASATPAAASNQEQSPATPSDKVDINEPAVAASEDTKPLSPQFAALAKQRRELQLERQKLDAEKAAIGTQSADAKSLEEYRSRIKANALSVLMEEGVTYDQLTEQILASNQENADLTALKAEIQALKTGLEDQKKSLTDKDAQTEIQVKAQIKRDVDALVAQGDDFEMIREAGYATKVVELIDKVWKQEGVLLDEKTAATMVEKELLEESLRFARIKKVQSALAPAPTTTPPRAPAKQDQPGTKVMRTLTNRDGVSSTSMSKRERAIAAMEGRLKA